LDDPAAVRRLLVPSVCWIHVLGAGVDGFPLDALGERTLTCSRGAAAPAIAEWVLAVMLAFEKQLPHQWIDAPPPHWNRAELGGLSGRTLGLVGVGSIGSAVARRALAFDMEVLGYRRRSEPAPLAGIELVDDLAALLGRSDHIVVAAPATPDTFHLLDAAAFDACKRGAHVVNVSRGSLVDQDALASALDDGRVARASLDTVDPEPLPAGHWLFAHPGVRLSAHVSWSAPSTMDRTIGLFVENLRRFRRGEALAGVVDPVAGY
ncbi:MAG TPA: NAD(P)-dependent oxidoreductase, partial [Acidimicrobiales bacterium]|nr:NAD(P)-dependent oxidoreductase [Acidimicrobiales bacterium]